VIQPVLPHHECAAESIANPTTAEFVPDPTTAESVANPAAAKFTTKPLHSVADPTTAGAILTETSCLCVQV
jgi:hypothetical protein